MAGGGLPGSGHDSARPDAGFSMIEVVVAAGVLFIALVAMAYSASVALVDVSYARQRQAATGLANQALEQVRALPYDTVRRGLSTADPTLGTDTNILRTGTSPSYVYSYGGETVPTGSYGTGGTTPLVPHQTSTTISPTIYTVSTYVTYAAGATDVYRATAVVTWTRPLRRGIPAQVQAQTLLHSPSGCESTATHPFAAPCQAFFYATGDSPAGSITITPSTPGGQAVTGLFIDHATLWLPSAQSKLQIEQVASAQGQSSTAGVALQLSGQSEQAQGRWSARSAADNDPAGSKPSWDYQTTGTSVAVPLVATGTNGNALALSPSSTDAGHSLSTIKATSTQTPQCTDLPDPANPAETDLQPCGQDRVNQGGSMTATATLAGSPFVLASVDSSLATTFTARDTAPDSHCTLTSGDGCVRAEVSRTYPEVNLAILPSGGGLVRVNPGVTQRLWAEAGLGSAAPASSTVPSSLVQFWNGSAYQDLPGDWAPGPIQFSMAGATVTMSPVLHRGGVTVSDPGGAGCSNPCTRQQASVTMGSLLTGTISYRAVAADGSVLADLVMTVDIGGMVAKTAYTPAPSGA